MTEYMVGVLREGNLLRWWPDIVNVLEEVPPESIWLRETGVNGLLELALHDHIQVWAAGTTKEFQLLLITRPFDYENGRVLKVEYAYGKNLDALLPQLDAMLEFCAAVHQCSKIVVVGREGWKRKLKPLGYGLEAVLLSKDIRKGKVH